MSRVFLNLFRSVFELTFSEQRAFYVLLPLLGLIAFSPVIYYKIFPEPQVPVKILFLADRALESMDTAIRQNRNQKSQSNQKLSNENEKLNASQRKSKVVYDINLADTSDFDAVSGIGWKTAVRIMKYRAALGGFISREQLYEIFGIDSLAVFSMDEYFVAEGFVPRRIRLNTTTSAELEIHPYLSRMQAKALLWYRFQHGNFKDSADLRKVRLLDLQTRKRLLPYLDFR